MIQFLGGALVPVGERGADRALSTSLALAGGPGYHFLGGVGTYLELGVSPLNVDEDSGGKGARLFWISPQVTLGRHRPGFHAFVLLGAGYHRHSSRSDGGLALTADGLGYNFGLGVESDSVPLVGFFRFQRMSGSVDANPPYDVGFQDEPDLTLSVVWIGISIEALLEVY